MGCAVEIAVLGATGRTGRHVVAQALARGHRVTALARRLDTWEERDGLVPASLDVLDRELVVDRLTGADAVVSAVGVGTSRSPTRTYSQGMRNVLHAMGAGGSTRLAVISAAPVGPRDAQPLVQRLLVMPVLDRLFGATYADMRRMEVVLGESQADWVCLRPPRLVDRPATGRYRLGDQRLPAGATTLTFGDLATALLDSLDRPDRYRRALYVGN
jgi:putative NADH-flavin reductase